MKLRFRAKEVAAEREDFRHRVSRAAAAIRRLECAEQPDCRQGCFKSPHSVCLEAELEGLCLNAMFKKAY